MKLKAFLCISAYEELFVLIVNLHGEPIFENFNSRSQCWQNKLTGNQFDKLQGDGIPVLF